MKELGQALAVIVCVSMLLFLLDPGALGQAAHAVVAAFEGAKP